MDTPEPDFTGWSEERYALYLIEKQRAYRRAYYEKNKEAILARSQVRRDDENRARNVTRRIYNDAIRSGDCSILLAALATRYGPPPAENSHASANDNPQTASAPTEPQNLQEIGRHGG